MRRSRVSGAAAACVVAIGLGMVGIGAPGSRTIHAAANQSLDCPVDHSGLRSALITADTADTTGLNNHYWAVVVNRDGRVCAVAYSGESRDSQWLLSRQIAAAKAFTTNGLSLDGAPLSTAQLYPWV